MSTNIRGQRTKNHILDAAWDLICEQGAEVSISDIAKTVGISRQAVYQHFSTRGGLLIALVRRADERFEIKEQFDAALALPNPKDRFTQTLHVWLDFIPKIYPVAKDLIRLRDTDQEAAAAWEDRMTDLRAWLLSLMRSLQDDDLLQDVWTPKSASEFFWAETSVQIWGLLVHECKWREEHVKDKLQRSLTDTLLNTGSRTV